ncbi:hypothetical protein B0H10DRAFT_2214442 [Mycena sp. CBHHK59/15]|nr:hypothetical protein B0H10DRAFT_2214442 [Mycena sp. CBHHK59/15]
MPLVCMGNMSGDSPLDDSDNVITCRLHGHVFTLLADAHHNESSDVDIVYLLSWCLTTIGGTATLTFTQYATGIYMAVQKVHNVDVVSILPLCMRIRSYMLSVGKLNPTKLANFMEIEYFVLVTCPENSVVEDKGFLCLIVTLYELELTLQAMPTWMGCYMLDFECLFAFAMGKCQHVKRYGAPDKGKEVHLPSSSVVLRNQDSTIVLAAGVFRGLEVHMAEDMLSVLEQGLSGIVWGYTDDPRGERQPDDVTHHHHASHAVLHPQLVQLRYHGLG